VKAPIIKSEFALLDVLSKSERRLLQRQLEARGPMDITIKGKLTRVWGNHDGTSQEYEVCVKSVEVAE
jgi:hypothetical protein